MQKFVYAFVLATLFAVPAWGQQKNTATKTQPAVTPAVAQTTPVANTFSPGEMKVTPEMWFYEQNKKEYKDPKNAVRAKAEFAAQQRANRLAAMRWFGLSNSRPRIGCDPINVYPPSWSSNTPLQPNRWTGTGGQPYYVARPEHREVGTY
jgi:hypothetical protein